MKYGLVTKLDKGNKNTFKTWHHVDKLWRHCHFFWFMANLEQSGSRIPDTLFVKLTLTLEVTFCLPKLKNFKHRLHTIALSKGTIFAKKCWFFFKKMLLSAILRGSWHWQVYFLKFLKLYKVCVFTYQVFRQRVGGGQFHSRLFFKMNP